MEACTSSASAAAKTARASATLPKADAHSVRAAARTSTVRSRRPPLPSRRLVFDAGGVLVGDAFSHLFPEIAEHLGVDLDDVLAFYHEQRSDLWQGGMAEEDFWTRMVERFPALDSARWRRRLLELSSPLPGAAKLEAWGAEAEIWVLSNHRHEWLHPLLDEAGALPHIDRLLISSTEGTMKPNPEAFAPLVEGVATEGRERRVLFVDDKETNLRAAEQLGIATVLADSEDDWHEDVDRWLADGGPGRDRSMKW